MSVGKNLGGITWSVQTIDRGRNRRLYKANVKENSGSSMDSPGKSGNYHIKGLSEDIPNL